jgi:predicted RNA-binding protein (virulence factor B family)
MIKNGKVQYLEVESIDKKEMVLTELEGDKLDKAYLKLDDVTRKFEVGEKIKVFIYMNAEGTKIATLQKPRLELGEIGYLEVIKTEDFGVFMDLGIEKDLFLPFSEQITEVKQGMSYMVALTLDKADRLVATMKILKHFVDFNEEEIADSYKGVVYDMKDDMGIFVVVDKKYNGMVPRKEIFDSYAIGQKVNVRITKVRDDKKVDLSFRKSAVNQIDDDMMLVLSKMAKNGGQLPYNDKTDPEIIKKEFKMSKRGFKRAIGRLYKEGHIEITDEGIVKK